MILFHILLSASIIGVSTESRLVFASRSVVSLPRFASKIHSWHRLTLFPLFNLRSGSLSLSSEPRMHVVCGLMSLTLFPLARRVSSFFPCVPFSGKEWRVLEAPWQSLLYEGKLHF